MVIVSPGRMVVGWETTSLIEGKRLKRGCRAVDHRAGKEEKGQVSQSCFILIIKLCNPEKLKVI